MVGSKERKNENKSESKPKKKLSGYMAYAKERRPKLVEEQPGLTFVDIGRTLGAEWRGMSHDEKNKYKK